MLTVDKLNNHQYTYAYPHPAVTVDCVVFGLGDADLQLLLIQRKYEPFQNHWALPGGFVGINESVDEAAKRELMEESGIQNAYLQQFRTFGEPNRDPRERVISVAYYSLVRRDQVSLRAATDAREAGWFELGKLPPLAFDHETIITEAMHELRENLRTEPLGFELLPEKFKLSQLQRVYELILDRKLDKRNFRRRMLQTELLAVLPEWDRSLRRRPAQLYRFDVEKHRQMKADGICVDWLA